MFLVPSLLRPLRLCPLEVLTRHGLRGDDIEHGLPGSEIRVGYRPKRRVWDHVRRGAVHESVLASISQTLTRSVRSGRYIPESSGLLHAGDNGRNSQSVDGESE